MNFERKEMTMNTVDLKLLKVGMKVVLRSKKRYTVERVISSSDKSLFRVSFIGMTFSVDYKADGSAKGGFAGTHDIVKISTK